MRLHNKALSFIVNFLLGISWAIVFVGAISSFLSYYVTDSIFLGVIYFFIGAIPGMVFVLLLELFILQKEKLYELQKQTKILEKLQNSSLKNSI